MRWKGRRQSDNVEDRRGSRVPKKMAGGSVGALLLIALVYLLGGDPAEFTSMLGEGTQSSVESYQPTAEEDEQTQFVKVVLAETEDVWGMLFQQAGMTYRQPRLVLFNGQVESACGFSSAATGPFYCPGDEKVYIDLSFLNELQRRLNAPGDFAQAYVIAHEVGHHVQRLLGVTDQVMALRNQVSEKEFNQYMVRLELQADFYAGIWAHHAERMHNILEEGDIEEALNAASAVGDDRIQQQTQGRIVPDAFTHGTSEQRSRWFSKGFKTGDINEGNTFEAQAL